MEKRMSSGMAGGLRGPVLHRRQPAPPKWRSHAGRSDLMRGLRSKSCSGGGELVADSKESPPSQGSSGWSAGRRSVATTAMRNGSRPTASRRAPKDDTRLRSPLTGCLRSPRASGHPGSAQPVHRQERQANPTIHIQNALAEALIQLATDRLRRPEINPANIAVTVPVTITLCI